MSGAAFLSAKAAYRTGAGLVHVLTHEVNRIILQSSLPEAILTTYTDENINKNSLSEAISRATAIVVGVGLGKSDRARELVDFTLKNSIAPIIADADALNIISENTDIHKLFTEIPFFPLAFLKGFGYYILALKIPEC